MRALLCLALFLFCGLLLNCAGAPGRRISTPVGGAQIAATPRRDDRAENLLHNPNFENNWFNRNLAEARRFLLLQATDAGMGEEDGHIDYWTTTGANVVWDTKAAHGGARSVRFEAPGSITQRLRLAGENGWVVGGASYGGFLPMASVLARGLQTRPIIVGAWCKTEAADAPPRLVVNVILAERPDAAKEAPGPLATTQSSVSFEAGSHDWQYRELTVERPPGGTPYYALVSLTNPGKGKVWFDDAVVLEPVGTGERNLVPNPDFVLLDPSGFPAQWSKPILWTWFRNEYYTFTGWTHEKETSWRGQAVLDRLVTWNGNPTLRLEAFPGDNFAVGSAPIQLQQKEAYPLEVRAMVRADQLRTLEIMAQDERGHWLPQGDFLGDDMEDNPATYNMGSTGSGTYEWRCVRKYFSPRQPVKRVRLFLCVRGFDGVRVPKNLVGTVWWSDVQLYQRADAPAPQVQGSPPPPLPWTAADLDLGERLYGKNELRLRLQGTAQQLQTLRSARLHLRLRPPGQAPQEGSAGFHVKSGVAEAVVPYTVRSMCRNPSQQYSLEVRLAVPGQKNITSRYCFGTPPEVLEAGGSSYFPYPSESPIVYTRLNVARAELAELSRCELVEESPGQAPRVLLATHDLASLYAPRRMPDYLDSARLLACTVKSSGAVHPWTQPTRDRQVKGRLYRRDGTLVAESPPFVYGFMEKPPLATLPSPIQRTAVDERGYLRINGQPYFPVYWTPGFDKPSEGNFPPRHHGARCLDLNSAAFPGGSLPKLFSGSPIVSQVEQARTDPQLFGYSIGDGEMQLQGLSWPLRLEVVKKAIALIHETDPHHVVCGPESWLVGHPGRDAALRSFVPYFDVVGAEASFEEVPLVNQYARPHYGAGHNCAVLAGLEAYFYQPVESMRWRGYRSIYEGCSGVGLCPSEMLRARPETLTYLRGLNGEFRGLERVFTALEPPTRITHTTHEIQTFERVHGGHRYLFALRAPGKTGTQKVEFTLPWDTTSVTVRCESRRLDVRQRRFTDTFTGPYAVHVYEF